MEHLGIDVHKKESQICILGEGGELIERRIRTEPERARGQPVAVRSEPRHPAARRSQVGQRGPGALADRRPLPLRECTDDVQEQLP